MDEGAGQERQRTTAMGLLTDAKEMLKAAEILHASGVWEVTVPTYYLLGHAIEETLKSFLLSNGDTMERMKNRIGHDIAKAARRVIATKCEPVSSVVKDNLRSIELLNHYYQAKELEYRVTGAKRYPQKDDLLRLLQTIIPAIEPIAYQAYKEGRA